VQYANGKGETILGSGTIEFAGNPRLKATAMHVRNLSDTLLSVNKAVQGGRAFLFTETECMLLSSLPNVKASDRLINGRVHDGIYRLNSTIPDSHA
jgi:hypothetical protein